LQFGSLPSATDKESLAMPIAAATVHAGIAFVALRRKNQLQTMTRKP
jgi:hypothetical protein